MNTYLLALDIDHLTGVMQWFTNYGTKQLDTPTRLMSGALAGITSVCLFRFMLLSRVERLVLTHVLRDVYIQVRLTH